MAQAPGVAEIFRRAGPAYRQARDGLLDACRRKVMGAIEACRTAVLGGHLYHCDGCGREHPLYNSCQNRHCPTCQGNAARKWMEARAAAILPVPYFHVVFTLPPEIARIGLANRRLLAGILFRTAHETLRTIAADPRHGGRRIGGTSVLHTWDQKLRFHPHLHVVIPNAGIDTVSGAWTTGSSTFLAPVKVLASLFRRRFLEELAKAHDKGKIKATGSIAHLACPAAFHDTISAARGKDWVVYAKPPFRGPEQVFAYLSRYTHRIAIGDSRILAFDGTQVRIRCRKPKRPGQAKPRYGTITLTAEEFIDRFLLHVLPDGMQRIRHFGILANNCRAETLQQARDALGIADLPTPEQISADGDSDSDSDDDDVAPVACPHCGGVLRKVAPIPKPQRHAHTPRAPPRASLTAGTVP
ncbi:MAG: IS91 family transposase [Gemmatimonadetes bacterium]|nr:IS91 family transposase [Gemmatimonadota bacterium]